MILARKKTLHRIIYLFFLSPKGSNKSLQHQAFKIHSSTTFSIITSDYLRYHDVVRKTSYGGQQLSVRTWITFTHIMYKTCIFPGASCTVCTLCTAKTRKWLTTVLRTLLSFCQAICVNKQDWKPVGAYAIITDLHFTVMTEWHHASVVEQCFMFR